MSKLNFHDRLVMPETNCQILYLAMEQKAASSILNVLQGMLKNWHDVRWYKGVALMVYIYALVCEVVKISQPEFCHVHHGQR